jgi:hypothetical protein
MTGWATVAAWGGGAYLLVAGILFWILVSYEHMGRSGLRSALYKPRSDVLALALFSICWLPLLCLSLARRTPRW